MDPPSPANIEAPFSPLPEPRARSPINTVLFSVFGHGARERDPCPYIHRPVNVPAKSLLLLKLEAFSLPLGGPLCHLALARHIS